MPLELLTRIHTHTHTHNHTHNHTHSITRDTQTNRRNELTAENTTVS